MGVRGNRAIEYKNSKLINKLRAAFASVTNTPPDPLKNTRRCEFSLKNSNQNSESQVIGLHCSVAEWQS